MRLKVFRKGSFQRSGSFLLASVLIMLTIIFIMAMTRNFFSRQRLQMADHMRDYEYAYQMAASGMTVGVSLFDQAMQFLNDSKPETYPKRDKAPAAIKTILQTLLDDQGLPHLKGASVIIDGTFINTYLKEFPHAHGVQLTMEMRPKSPLFKGNTDPGFHIDVHEMAYDFLIQAEGSYGASTVRVTTFFEGRFVNILPPVLGKFSLFIRDQPPGGVNKLIDSKTPASIQNSPLTITSGGSAGPNSLLPNLVTPFFEKQGWVFLGGLSPWRLNVSEGGGNPDLSECFLRSDLFLSPIVPGDTEFATEISAETRFSTSHVRLYKELLAMEKDQVLLLKQPNPEYVQTSLLHLFGSTRKPSPTLVFGNASRRWLLANGVYHPSKADPGYFPFMDAATFQSTLWPGSLGDSDARQILTLLKGHFNNSFDAYSQKMSDIWEEEINATNLYALNMDGTPAKTSPILTSTNLPTAFSGSRSSKLMSVNNAPADFFKMNVGSAYELKNTVGKTLFSGGDLSRIENLSFLTNKAGFVFENEKEFWKNVPRNPGNEIHVGGVILIKGNLTISAPLVISATGGGMIISTGNVRIKSPVKCQGTQPLSIISLTNDLWVETAGQVHAALVAVQGQVHLPKECIINGLVAAKSLNLEMGSPSLKREINYQTRFDPTDAETYVRGYRMMIPTKRYSFVH